MLYHVANDRSFDPRIITLLLENGAKVSEIPLHMLFSMNGGADRFRIFDNINSYKREVKTLLQRKGLELKRKEELTTSGLGNLDSRVNMRLTRSRWFERNGLPMCDTKGLWAPLPYPNHSISTVAPSLNSPHSLRVA